MSSPVSVFDAASHSEVGTTPRESDGEQLYRDAFELWPDPLFLIEVTASGRFRCIAFNRAEERLVGVSGEQSRGRYVEELLCPQTAAVVIASFQRCVATARPVSYEEELHLPAGPRQCFTTLVPILDGQGRVHRIVGRARDITEQLRATRGLRASEENLRLLTDNIREVFWVFDTATSEVRYVSPAYEAVWGRSCESLRQAPRSWLDAIHMEDRARVEENVGRQREVATETTYRIVRPDGSMRWIRDRSFPVRDACGHVRRVVGLAEDVTTLVKTEERLRQVATLDALGRLAGGVAHDFNNLLSVMQSYLELTLGSPGLSDQQQQDLGVARAACESAASLTRQLLTFSRQEAVQSRLIDVRHALVGMGRMLRRLLREDIELVLDLTAATTAVRMDPGHLEQVLMNLTINARDAMPRGGRLIIATHDVVVSADESAAVGGVAPGRYVKVTVTDDGTGMTPETRARIFEPFFTTKERGQGTGLGLATVFGIVEKSDGVIHVDSEPGRGTTFAIYLPAAHAATSMPVAATSAGHPLRGSETVLLVEDDPLVREVARALLTRNGYEVLDAGNAGEALLVCEGYAHDIQLLVTDVVMPLMSGPRLARRLTALRPAMRVLYTSGYPREASSPDDDIAPGDAFVAKPFTPLELTRRVREVLDATPEPQGDRS